MDHTRIKLLIAVMLVSFTVVAQYDPKVPFKGKLGKTPAETTQWYPEKLRAPKGAPNVIWILLDDAGYAATGRPCGIWPPIEVSSANYLLKSFSC